MANEITAEEATRLAAEHVIDLDGVFTDIRTECRKSICDYKIFRYSEMSTAEIQHLEKLGYQVVLKAEVYTISWDKKESFV